jgi:hypothetical protein
MKGYEIGNKTDNLTNNFQERLSEYTPEEVENMPTVKVWIFEKDGEEYFFIVNNLFQSNYREKIESRLIAGSKFVKEIDTTEELEKNDKGDLTLDSLLKMLNISKELDKQYKKLIS